MRTSKNRQINTEEGENLASERGDLLKFRWGTLSLKEIRALLDAIPLDINLIDRHDVILYYNESGGKIFNRNEKVIGNKVQLCHPEAVRPKVTEVLDDFRQGRRDISETRGEINGRPTRWRYIALRDPQDGYIGAACIVDHLDA